MKEKKMKEKQIKDGLDKIRYEIAGILSQRKEFDSEFSRYEKMLGSIPLVALKARKVLQYKMRLRKNSFEAFDKREEELKELREAEAELVKLLEKDRK